MAPSYLRYANQGATRNQALDPRLVSALGFLGDLGVTAEVFSGGQPGKGSGGKRVGSVRHDHGNAADVRFYQGDRQIDWANPQDRPLFEQIVQRGKAAGITGFGAGPGYMGAGTMHVGFGSPGVWGAGGRAANAPDWLRAAYNGGPSAPTTGGASSAIANTMGLSQPASLTAYDQTREPSMAAQEGPKQSTAIGGLGGLGGWNPPGPAKGEIWGDVLSALGSALIAGDARAIPMVLDQRRDSRERRGERNFEREWRQMMFETARGDRSQDIARDDARFGIQSQRYDAEQTEGRRRWEADHGLQTQRLNAPTADIQEYEYARRNGFQGSFEDWQARSGAGGGPKTSLSPVYGTDESGNAVLLQPRDDGTIVRSAMPEGVTLSTGVDRIDAGTHWVLQDKRSGQTVGTIPKDNFGEAFDTALGTNAGKGEVEQASGAGQSYRQADQMLTSIDGILDDPYLDWSTGMGGGVLSSIPGTPMRGVRARIDQLGGQAFLQAFESLRGGGQITEVEGIKATQAVARLDQAQSPEDYRTALKDLRDVVEAGRSRAETLMRNPPRTSQGAPIRPPAAPNVASNNDPLGLR